MTKTLEELRAERAKIDAEISAMSDTETPTEKPKPDTQGMHVVPEQEPESFLPNTDVNLDDRDNDFQLASDTRNVRFIPRHQLMAKTPRRQQDLKLQKFFWYKRLTDDTIQYYTEGEAAFMMKSSHAPILRLLGVSDGTAYARSIANCGVKAGAVIPRAKARQIISDAMDAELASALGNYETPQSQTTIIDDSIRKHANAAAIISGLPI